MRVEASMYLEMQSDGVRIGVRPELDGEPTKFWGAVQDCESARVLVASHYSRPTLYDNTNESDADNGLFDYVLSKRLFDSIRKAADIGQHAHYVAVDITRELAGELASTGYEGYVEFLVKKPGLRRSRSQSHIEATFEVVTGSGGSYDIHDGLGPIHTLIAVPHSIVVDSLVPSFQLETGGKYSLYERVDSASTQSASFTFTDMRSRRVESLLAVLFPAVLGIGAAGLFEAVTKALTTPLRVRRARRDANANQS